MILLEGTLFRPLPIEQVNLKIYLPNNNIYLSQTTERDFSSPAKYSHWLFFCHTLNCTRKISNDYIKRKTKYDQFSVIFNNSGTLGTRGFSRVRREFSETALEKSLAPRVQLRSLRWKSWHNFLELQSVSILAINSQRQKLPVEEEKRVILNNT